MSFNNPGNMTSGMVNLARFHLKAADSALANGNTVALNELTLAQLQVLMLGMKPMGRIWHKPCNFSKVQPYRRTRVQCQITALFSKVEY